MVSAVLNESSFGAVPVRAVRAWTTVSILTLFYAFSMLDRLILSMLIGPIKRDLGIGDFDVGLLIGLSFALTYVLLGTPFGMLADRYPRRWLIAAGLLIWSLSTIACGFVQSYAGLFALRMMVGVGEAALSPAAFSLISDLFPRDRRGLPLSIYQTASPIGSAASATLGGLAIDWASNGVAGHGVFSAFHNWQLVFLWVGIPGLALLPLSVLLPEPRPTGTRVEQSAPKSLRRYFSAHARLLSLFFLTFGITVTVSFAIGTWTAEHMVRSYGWTRAQVGAVLGPIMFLTLISHLVTGPLMDRMASRGVRDAPLLLFQRMALIALPFGVIAYLASEPWVTITCLGALALLFIPSLGFASNALQMFAPDAIRGRLSGAFLSFISFTGAAMGPALVGGMSEYLFKGGADLRFALAGVVGGGICLVCLLLGFTRGELRNTIE